MRTDNWETETLIHKETLSLRCSCGQDHDGHLSVAREAIRIITL